MMATEDAAREIERLRGEVADLRSRLESVEALLRGLYGGACLGGDSRPAAPAVEPQPKPTRVIGVMGPRPSGFFS